MLPCAGTERSNRGVVDARSARDHVTFQASDDVSLTDVGANRSEFELLAVLEHAARAWVHTKLLRP
jgi:hypothetical protein